MDKIFLAIPLFVYQSAYKTKKFWKSKYFERGIKGYLNNPIHGYLFKHFVHSAYTRSFSYFEYIKQYNIFRSSKYIQCKAIEATYNL